MKYLLPFLLLTISITSCVKNNVKQRPQYKQFFEKYKLNGTFATYDNVYNEFSVYNLKRFRDSAYSPASTFKIINSLIGIETGILDPKEVMKWDGKPKAFKQWEADYAFKEAFQNSVVWYFQDVARRIGKPTMQKYLDSMQYGSKKIIGAVDSFWLNNTLTLTSDEQMGILKRVYFNKLSNLFSSRTMSIVKDAMLMEKTDKYSISYKTGLTIGKNGLPLSWIIGWVEHPGANPTVNFFVLNAEGNVTTDEMINTRKLLLMDLLKEEKLLSKES